MKILVVHPDFADTSTPAATIRTVAEHLAARGHRVTALAVRRRGGEQDTAGAPLRDFRAGVRIIRTRLPSGGNGGLRNRIDRWRFVAFAFAYAVRHRFDVLWTTSDPAVLNGVVARVAARGCGARLLYQLHRVQPEADIAAGTFRPRIAAAAAKSVDSWTCRSAAAVIVHSDDAMQTVGDRGGNGAVAFHLVDEHVADRTDEDRRLAGLTRWREIIEALGAE